MRSMHHDFFSKESDNFVEVELCTSEVHLLVLDFCVFLCPYPSVSLQLSAAAT